jgi:hypothetical protein
MPETQAPSFQTKSPISSLSNIRNSLNLTGIMAEDPDEGSKKTPGGTNWLHRSISMTPLMVGNRDAM